MIERMRRIKSRAEIAVLRKTGDMAARVCIEGMKATRPGMPAAGLQAIGEYVYRSLGNCGLGYEFEVSPSHPQSAVLLDGDMVLVDGGPDYHHYTSDIARIWPVNGHFDSWQRHTYGLIADYMETLLRLTAPGKLIQDIYAEAASSMLQKYEGDEAGLAIIQNMMRRGVSYINHHVGMSVHDAVGSWKEEPLQAGMVVVIDPMVWLDQAPHGYIRVEDTVVITEQGCERLTGLAPVEPEAIEETMKQPSAFPVFL
jgi:Xaa-Pro aminopeptidase